MQARGWILMRVLANRYHKGHIDPLLKCLPDEDQKAILAQEVHSKDPQLIITHPAEIVRKTHYSWLAKAIRKFPKPLYPAILSLMQKQQVSRLKALLGETITTPLPRLAPPLRRIFEQQLFHSLEPAEVLPAEYLPKSPLNALTKWKKAQIAELIDLLGIYDLAEEIRKTIDKGQLNRIQPCLTPKKKLFLRVCLHKPEKVISSTRLPLDKWQGDLQELNRMLHQRGLLRFGKALSSQHPDLVWHIAHILDTGRGEAILDYYSTAAIPGVTPVLMQQLLNTMNFLNK